MSFFQLDDPTLIQIRDEITEIDINTLTPVEALMKLNEIKKLDIPVILLSNAPRRASNVERKLNRIGIDKSLYNEIISSGEICRNELISKRHQVPGNNYYFIFFCCIFIYF